MRDKDSQVPDAVRGAWQATVARCIGDLDQSQEYWLTELLKANEALAVDWLVSSFGCDDWRHAFSVRQVRGKILAVIGPLARVTVLTRLGPRIEDHASIVREVVQGDTVAYAALLRRAELRRVHLAPLCRVADATWPQLAEAALDAGYSVGDVARAPFDPDLGAWRRLPDSEMRGWRDLFRRLQRSGKTTLRAVGRAGHAFLSAL